MGNNTEKPVYTVGIAGSSCSGKTSYSKEIERVFGDRAPEGKRIAIIGQDSFYVGPVDGEDPQTKNYDVLDAIEWPLLVNTVKDLLDRKPVEVPVYDFKTHTRLPHKVKIDPVDVVIIEGILIFNCKELLPLLDLKIFVNASPDLCLARRITRDIKERGRDVNGTIMQYLAHVKPSNDNLVIPSQRFADIVVNNDNSIISPQEFIKGNISPVFGNKFPPAFELVMDSILLKVRQ